MAHPSATPLFVSALLLVSSTISPAVAGAASSPTSITAPAAPAEQGQGSPGDPTNPSSPADPGAAADTRRPVDRGAPVVYDDSDGLSEGEQWTRTAADARLADLATTVGQDLPVAAFSAAGVPLGVAVIDTGVADIPGLDHVIHGPDLSFDSQAENLIHADGYGHGTHMAGIIGGRGVDGPDGLELVGLAPQVDLYSIKVGSHSGAVDVSQVIAAVDWVSQHADALGIRVLNISYGTDSIQSWDVDPLAYAVENAWRSGVVVVVAAGNDGRSRDALRNPAISPWVIAVGASDSNDTPAVEDDTLAEFSNRGTDARRVDVLAPGVGIVSYRVPGSVLDEAYPAARRGEAGFSGHGTSQAAAVVSGVVANLLQSHPTATPDQVKAALLTSGQPLTGGDPAAGAGVLSFTGAELALRTLSALVLQDPPVGEATGTLDDARGTMRLEDLPTHFVRSAPVLRGEIDIHRQPFAISSWAEATTAGRAWEGGTWNGVEWTGSSFDDDVWSGRSWSGRSWSGRSWSGRSWSGRSWSGRSWSGDSWAADGASFLSTGWLSSNPW